MKKKKTSPQHNINNQAKAIIQGAKQRYIVGILILICCILSIILILMICAIQCQIEFYNTEDVYVEVFSKTEFDPPIATITNSSIFGSIKPKVILENGAVDNTKVGDYHLVYSASFASTNETCEKIVHVVDTEIPNIRLKHDSSYYVTDLNDYVEEGFVATDNYDGDLTDSVIVVNRGDYYVYTVQDSSGNETSTTRKIPYKDIYEPEFTLKGSVDISLIQGDEYIEPGYTAMDNHDGDITEEVSVENNVDTNTPGYYRINYIISDNAGNVATAYRSVRVIEKDSSKIIYLTFDDGPSAYTRELLDILDKYNVKATFFVVNTEYPELMKEIVDRGHSIGAHTYSHRYSIYKDEPTYYQDLNKILALIKDNTGVDTKLIRFPGGSSNTISLNYCKKIMTQLAESVERHGYTYFDWSIDSGDAESATTREAVFQNIVEGIQGTSHPIILQHDTKWYSVQAVEDVIKWALENGYAFDKLSEDSFTAQHKIFN